MIAEKASFAREIERLVAIAQAARPPQSHGNLNALTASNDVGITAL